MLKQSNFVELLSLFLILSKTVNLIFDLLWQMLVLYFRIFVFSL